MHEVEMSSDSLCVCSFENCLTMFGAVSSLFGQQHCLHAKIPEISTDGAVSLLLSGVSKNNGILHQYDRLWSISINITYFNSIFVILTLQNGRFLLRITNKHFPIDISCSQCIHDTILLTCIEIIDGIKYTSIRTSSTTAVSFNLSLIDVFDGIRIIISLLQLIIMWDEIIFSNIFLTLFWNKSDHDVVSLDLTQIIFIVVEFASVAHELVRMDVIYAIFVAFCCMGAYIMYRNVTVINTIVINENDCNNYMI